MGPLIQYLENESKYEISFSAKKQPDYIISEKIEKMRDFIKSLHEIYIQISLLKEDWNVLKLFQLIPKFMTLQKQF